MQTTTNFGLNKPESTDSVLIEKLNENMDIIDTQLGKVDSSISSTSENPVQNKVIEKYLEPVLGKPQEQGVPTVNLTGSSYPINSVTENGKIISFVAGNETSQYYYELVLPAMNNSEFNVNDSDISIGFYKTSTAILPFLFYGANLSNRYIRDYHLKKYDTAGNLIKDISSFYSWFWDATKFAAINQSLITFLPLVAEPSSLPCNIQQASLKSTEANTFIPYDTEYITVISGDVYVGTSMQYASRSNSGNYNLYSFNEPYPVFTQWWSECNVTYGGAVAKTPFAQLQDDVEELKKGFVMLEIPSETGWYNNDNLDTPLPSSYLGTAASENKCYLFANGKEAYLFLRIGLHGENADTQNSFSPRCDFTLTGNIADHPELNFSGVPYVDTLIADSVTNPTWCSVTGGIIVSEGTFTVGFNLQMDKPAYKYFEFSKYTLPLLIVPASIFMG